MNEDQELAGFPYIKCSIAFRNPFCARLHPLLCIRDNRIHSIKKSLVDSRTPQKWLNVRQAGNA